MPINLPPISQQLVKNLEQARTEQLATLSKLVGITLGNNILASVEKVEPINPQQREDLLKRTQEALLQLYRSPQTPAIKAQISQLIEQQQLLASPQLKWVHLLVNNRPLLTYTDKPLLAGQSLPVQITEAQRLVALDPLLAPKVADSLARAVQLPGAGAESQRTLGQTPAAPLLPGQQTSYQTAIQTSAQTAVQTSNPAVKLTLNISAPEAGSAPVAVTDRAQPAAEGGSRQQTQALLAEALRNLLPQKDRPQQLYGALPAIQQLSSASRHELLSNTLQQALKTVADQLRSPAQLSNPKLLQMIVKNSGVFFEHKLAANLVTGEPGKVPSSTGSSATASSGNQPANQSAGASTLSDKAVLTNRLTSQDLKGALLQLLHRVNQDLAATGKMSETTPSSQTPSSQTPSTNPNIDPATQRLTPAQLSLQPLPQHLPGMLQLLQQLPQRGPELSHKVLRTQLLMLLQQHTLGSLAKVQMQQVHSLNHQQNQTDTAQPTQSWLFEIPVKQGHEVHTMEMRLQQDWVEEEQENKKGGDGKIRRWSVTLSFNLPDAGNFYAQLTVINDSVSATLWAEQESTLMDAKLKLDQLREQLQAQGVTVKQLQCVQGAPPSTSISLHYSLVDVTT